ncbi:MAG TPA: pyridoxine 5'-phosphate synthase [Candidatus Omnitrophota bacterium]|nr:pyridoxine 5'-phosphate synthase [Candidatus Omnitrophota bacterium]
MRLGVNIDHIATLRQARMEGIPDPVEAAKECIAAGADGIVCHLREDRRHIQDDDLASLRALKTRLDMEMAATDEMVKIALKVRPDMVTLVPEKRAELTTEGGLDIVKHSARLKKIVSRLQGAGITVSLFIDPKAKQVAESAVVGAKFIEIHTGRYANAKVHSKRSVELESVGNAVQQARMIGLRINGGHGLDYNNVKGIVGVPGIEELNIGFSIIARSVIVGMRQAVAEMRRVIG